MRRFRLYQWALIFLFAYFGHVGLSQVQYVGIPSFTFTPAAQMADEWCWAASIQMILNYYRIPVTQPMIVARVHGALTDQGGSDDDISRGLNGWVPTVNGGRRIVQSSNSSGPPPPVLLIQELNQRHPILLTFATGPYSGHAVVITAASFTPTPYGPYIRSLVIRDPWPSQQNIMTGGRVEIAGQVLANFLPSVRSYWQVSVMDAPENRARETNATTSEEENGSAGSSNLCDDLAVYVKAAAHNFTSLKGALTASDGTGRTYNARSSITGYERCHIVTYSDADLTPSAVCYAVGDDLEGLWNEVKACFPNREDRHRTLKDGAEQYEIVSQNGVNVRLRSGSHTRLWVDAPDKDE